MKKEKISKKGVKTNKSIAQFIDNKPKLVKQGLTIYLYKNKIVGVLISQS